MSLLERALELAERGRGRRAPEPASSARSSSRDGEVVGEGWRPRRAGRHAEVVALDAAGERARGATLYVTLEPCAHHGPHAAVRRRGDRGRASRASSSGSLDPNPEAGGGLERLREAGVEVELADSFEARAPERGLAHVGALGPPVRHLQGRGRRSTGA